MKLSPVPASITTLAAMLVAYGFYIVMPDAEGSDVNESVATCAFFLVGLCGNAVTALKLSAARARVIIGICSGATLALGLVILILLGLFASGQAPIILTMGALLLVWLLGCYGIAKNVH